MATSYSTTGTPYQQQPHRVEIDLRQSKGENKMADPVNNIFTSGFPGGSGGGMDGLAPMAAIAALGGNRGPMGDGFGMGGGLGAGLVGGLLGGLLFGGGDRFGRVRDDTLGGIPAQAAGDLALMAAIGNLKDTINAAQTGVTAQLSEGFAQTNTNTLQQTQLLTAQASINQLSAIQALASVNQNVSAQGSDTRTAITADGAATRALITQLNTDNLNRLLTVADLDRRDERNSARQREVEVNVSQTVNQNQLQLQAQAQQQGIISTLGFIAQQLAAVHQEARATNSVINAGNTGAVTTGAQTANPVNVNAPS